MKELYTLKEVAETLGFATKTVQNWVYQGKIKCVRVLGNVRITKEELERLKKGE